MEEVQIKDKRFALYLSPAQIQERVGELAKALNDAYQGQQPVALVVLNGAFIFAADLLRALSVSPQAQFIRLSSYDGGLETTEQVREVLGLTISLRDRHVLIIEDIVDSGLTAQHLRAQLAQHQPASVAMVSLLFKPDALRVGQPPEYVGFSIASDFVVGYGLDYAHLGREYPGIYRLKA